jgi:branched-chain amino acid transport system permease protein
MTTGWWSSDFYSSVRGEKGIHVGVSDFTGNLPGIHFNLLLIMVGAIIICATAGVLIGLPTLRLRGDYIAIVTLAFGEIIGRVFANGDEITIFGDDKLSNGRQSISPIDQINLPVFGEFDSALNLRPYYWTALALCLVVLFVNFRLRDSRLGRAWIALREDEVAAASMGVPLVKTKLLSYAAGGAFGGISGAFLGPVYASVNANQFQFGFSIFILAMVILGGLGSIWGVVLGAVALGFLNHWFIPDVLDGEFVRDKLDSVGLNFAFTEVSFGVFGFLLLLMMVLRPEGLIPERRHVLELGEGTGELEEPGALTVEARV